MTNQQTLVWFRNDLRTADNPALYQAMTKGHAHACFVICDPQWRAHDVGANRLSFLRSSLCVLADALSNLGVPLTLLRAADVAEIPDQLVKHALACNANTIAFNREYPHDEHARDAQVEFAANRAGIAIETHHGNVALPPGSVVKPDNTPYSVFTPFKKRWIATAQYSLADPLPAPTPQGPALNNAINWDRPATAFTEWPAGEDVAAARLSRFLADQADRYEESRDIPSQGGTSKLSPYLSNGSLSIKQCLSAALTLNRDKFKGGPIDAWITELIWREFYHHVVALYPHVSRGQAFRRQYDQIQWRNSPADLAAWKAGETGYPFVDAGMKQLINTGWMHNRLRMITAMFLTKHLLIDWREGERFFMQHLIDGDFAANNGGWQWSASTGTDAVPYFRIFNPSTQGRRFDPEGHYVKTFLPQLAAVQKRDLYEPTAKVTDIDYPAPIVDHKFARDRALATFKNV